MSTMEKQRAGTVLPTDRSRRSVTAEFKADAASLVLDEGRSVASVARSLGIGATNLGNWVRPEAEPGGPPMPRSEAGERGRGLVRGVRPGLVPAEGSAPVREPGALGLGERSTM